MEERLQNQFDVDLAFSLCKDIIEERKFESLVQLDEQCLYLFDKIDPYGTNLLVSLEEDALFILLYYIFYILLDEKERRIFTNFYKLILGRNIILYDCYTKMTEEEWENFSIEEKKIGHYIIKILENYIKSTTDDEINIDKLNSLIYVLYKNNYQRIPNNFYMVIMIALGSLDVSDVLSEFSRNVLINRLNEINKTIIFRFFNDRESFDENNINKKVDDLFEDTANELRT